MAMNRNTVIGIVVAATTGLMVQKLRMEAAVRAQEDAKKKECECLGNLQTEKNDHPVEKSTFSNVLYGAEVNPHRIRSIFLNFSGKKKEEVAENAQQKGWESIRGPK